MHIRSVARSFHPLLASAVLSLLLTSAGTAQAQTRTSTFSVSGAFASESTCFVSGSLFTCIFVFTDNESSNQANPTPGITPFLDYLYSTVDLNTGIYRDFGGFGQIPVGAFKATSSTDTLSVDTSTVPGFINFATYFDPTTGVFIFGTAPGGLVTGTWTELPIGGSQSGMTTSSFPGSKFIATGTSDFNLASASVTVLGVGATGGDAQVGTQHNTSISIQLQ